jgi:putative ABC transport system permease protein
MPPPLRGKLVKDYPEIIAATGMDMMGLVIKPGDESFDETVRFADPEIFSMLSFELAEGDKDHPLEDMFSMAISEEIAQKYFKGEGAIGKTVTVQNEFEFTVTAVFKNLPYNMSYRSEIIIPFEFMGKIGVDLDMWGNNSPRILVELDDQAEWKNVSEKIKLGLQDEYETTAELFLHPLKDNYLHNLHYKGGNIEYVYIFAVIAFAILLLACINFMNLATARSVKRSKEIGIRKATGALRGQIIFQFFGESVLLSVISLNFAVVIVELLLPGINALSGKHLDIDYSDITLIGSFISIGVITGILAGIYPALYLSSFSPAVVLRGISKKSSGSSFRKVLVVIQFAISITLIISTTVVYNQLNYIMNADLGISRDHIVYLPLRSMVRENLEPLTIELKRLPMVDNVSASTALPNQIGSNGGGWQWEGKDPDSDVLISMTSSDDQYVKTFGMQMAQGRFYNKELATDSVNRVVINEKLVDMMGLDNAIGKLIFRGSSQLEIIGVVKNFNFQSIKNEIEPLIIFYDSWDHYALSIRVSGEEQIAMDAINDVYKEMYPDVPADLALLEQSIEDQYQREEKLGNVFQYFAILAIIISCLGLYGLSTFMAEQRKKEMGIRKTMGASVSIITKMMLTDFMKWVLIANLISWPIAWYLMDNWLAKFAFHVSFGWWIFVIAGLISIVIASSTVMFQSIKTGLTNPIHALKHE